MLRNMAAHDLINSRVTLSDAVRCRSQSTRMGTANLISSFVILVTTLATTLTICETKKSEAGKRHA